MSNLLPRTSAKSYLQLPTAAIHREHIPPRVYLFHIGPLPRTHKRRWRARSRLHLQALFFFLFRFFIVKAQDSVAHVCTFLHSSLTCPFSQSCTRCGFFTSFFSLFPFIRRTIRYDDESVSCAYVAISVVSVRAFCHDSAGCVYLLFRFVDPRTSDAANHGPPPKFPNRVLPVSSMAAVDCWLRAGLPVMRFYALSTTGNGTKREKFNDVYV